MSKVARTAQTRSAPADARVEERPIQAPLPLEGVEPELPVEPYTIHLPGFDGPMDLLLTLIEKNHTWNSHLIPPVNSKVGTCEKMICCRHIKSQILHSLARVDKSMCNSNLHTRRACTIKKTNAVLNRSD